MGQISEESFLCGSGAINAMGLAARSGAGAVAPRAALPPGLVGLRQSLVRQKELAEARPGEIDVWVLASQHGMGSIAEGTRRVVLGVA
jgi:hypothetical protein